MCELDVDGDRLADFRVIGYVSMLGNSSLSLSSLSRIDEADNIFY